jgi:HEAT repeat protein
LPAATDPAIQQEIDSLADTDWRERRDSAQTLGQLGGGDKKAVAALTATLDDSDSRVRRAAADALGEIGRTASRSIPRLVERFDDIDTSVIEAAARAVGSMGPRGSRAVPDLTELLQHADARVRRAATESIGRIGRRASKSIGELGRQLSDPDSAVRAAAARSLGQMESKASSFSVQLLRLLNDDEPQVREAASTALARIGKPAVGPLIRSLRSGNPIFLQAAVETLSNIGKAAVPQLVKSLHDERGQVLVRRYSAMALARIGSGDKRVIPGLTAALDDEVPDIRMSAAQALGDIGPPAIGALRQLIAMSADQREELLVREYSIAALPRIAPLDEAVNKALVDAVADGDPRIYGAAVAALVSKRVETAASDGNHSDVAKLLRRLRSGTLDARVEAARRFGELGPYAAAAVSGLTDTLAARQNDAELRATAASSLGLIGPEAEAAVPELIRALGDQDQRLRDAALVALDRIGPQTKTIPALLQAMRSGRLPSRAAAAATVQSFARARMETWKPLLSQSDAPVLRHWLARHDDLYGVDARELKSSGSRADAGGPDYLDVLGGRAAIRESLQLDLIDDPVTGSDEHRLIPVSSIRSVTVQSHPFDKMLEDSDKPIRRLALAELAPADHFFAYFRDLTALRSVFAGGSDQFLRFESAVTVKSVEYDLEQRYMDRLGLNNGILNQLDTLGAIRDLAIITPDLFFVDGTDITVVVSLTSARLTQSVLRLMRLVDPGTAYEMRSLANGDIMYWALRGDVLVISDNLGELMRVLELHERQGKNSLGRSNEFLYMQQQLSVEGATEAYFYFSDAFIRNLVSPAVKIAQLRRMQARAEMEMLAAGAMHYLLDGNRNVPTKQQLMASGYVPLYFDDRDYTISDNLIVNSERYGTIAALKPLSANPVTDISVRERNAYTEFVAQYTRYWSQFFDPIATRLDRIDDNTREIVTFILPLLDSRLYAQVEEALVSIETGHRLNVPVMTPTPSMVFSLNVSDELRISLSRKLANALVHYTSVNPKIFDSIGSGIHLAVQDSTPIVAFGSGDVWGALSQEMLLMGGFESLLPFLLSLVTQPSTVLIELAEPAQVLEFLNDAVVRRSEAGSEGEFHRLQGKEAWIYSLNVFDMVQLHLRIEIKDGYLMISNLPWSTQLEIDDVIATDFNGAQIQLNLDEVSRQMPALHTKVFTDYGAAAVDGMGYLYPLLLTGVADTVPQAIAMHFEIFGFKPLHPSSGQWLWRDGALGSTEFGSVLRPVLPEFTPGDRDFGVFPTLEMLVVNMQLEDTGLRARIRWRNVP